MTRALDLGCGLYPRNYFNADQVLGVDIRSGLGHHVRTADLAIEPIPYESESFDFVTAHDFLEHIPRLVYVPERRHAFVELMSEIYRVLKLGGRFYSFTPAYPHSQVFQDPTHVNFITQETFPFYFDDTNCWARDYGFKGAFRIVHQEWQQICLTTSMEKVPIPPAKN